jgi:hypothetical protein
MTAPVTLERIERAITITAEAMTAPNLPKDSLPTILRTLKRLEEERDKLVSEDDPVEYAKRVLARRTAATAPAA